MSLLDSQEPEKQPLLSINDDTKENKKKSERVVSLDTLRGLTIFLMNFVNNAQGSYGFVSHAAWDGLSIADIVMPFFLFMVGMSLAIAYHKPLTNGSSKLELSKKAITRALKLFFIGLALHGGGPPYDLQRIRILGVLQRIGIAFFLSSLIVIFIPKIKYQGKYFAVLISNAGYWIAGLLFLITYTIIITTVAPPGCSPGLFTPQCSACGYLDTKILTPNHMYCCASCRSLPEPCPYFEPEGFISTIAATCSVFLGLYFGHFIVQTKDQKTRLINWSCTSTLFLTLGLALHFTVIPMNKNLYSISYIFATAGMIGFLFILVYIAQDILKFQKPFLIFTWTGMNSIILYVGDSLFGKILGFPNGSALVYYATPKNNFSTFLYKYLFVSWMPSKVALLMWGIFHAVFWILPAYILWRKKIFVRV